MAGYENTSTMRVPAHDSTLYLMMQQMGLIKQKDNGSEYVVCKSSIDIDGNGKIDGDRERVDTEWIYGKYGKRENCKSNTAHGIRDFYRWNLKYFDKAGVAKVAELMKDQAIDGLDASDEDEHLGAYTATMFLASIGQLYPEMVEDMIPVFGAMLDAPQSWAKEAGINALGWIGDADPFMVEQYVPRLHEIQEGINVNNGQRTTYIQWIACISLNKINQCGDEDFGSLDGCETDGSKMLGCGFDVFATPQQ